MAELGRGEKDICKRLRDFSGPLLVALLSGDESLAKSLVFQAREAGADFALLSREIIEPALQLVGEMWNRGEVSIAEEHLATALISRSVSVLAATMPSPKPGSPRILFTCLAGEFHELGVRIASEVAREAGWDAENLGGNVPREALLDFLSQRQPEAVGLSFSLTGHIVEAIKTVESIHETCPQTKVIVGSRIFRQDPSLIALVNADAAVLDIVAMRDWLRKNRPIPLSGRCKTGDGAPLKGLPAQLSAQFLEKLKRPE